MKKLNYFTNEHDGLILLQGSILSITKMPTGEIKFREECDSCFSHNYSKEDAIKLLHEAIEWIES